jgi:hypothetical protein
LHIPLIHCGLKAGNLVRSGLTTLFQHHLRFSPDSCVFHGPVTGGWMHPAISRNHNGRRWGRGRLLNPRMKA